jgi:phosphatidylserine decarboxylase
MLKSAVIPPTGWPSDPVNPDKLFIWPEKDFDDLLCFFERWLTFVPNHKNGMSYYELIYGLCYNNENALKFVETEPGLSWTQEFAKARGKYMDKPESINDHCCAMWDWKNHMGDHWYDFDPPHAPNVGFFGYKTFNEFFRRELKKNKRPVSYPDDDSILVSPSDGLVNIVNSNLNTDSLIHTKYDEYLNVDELLGGSKYARYFLGGTAVDTVLLPPDYHRYHSPVTGCVVESKELPPPHFPEVANCNGNVKPKKKPIGFYFGMDGQFFAFSNNGNIGGYKSKYGYFGRYHRGYYIFKTKHYGYVAMVPIGLDDISSVKFVPKFKGVGSPLNPRPVAVKKGDEVGHFEYGGSTIILLFQPGVLNALKVQQGNQIGVMNAIDHEKAKTPKIQHYYYHKKKVDK